MSPNSNRQVRILQVVGGMNRAGTETWLMHVLRNIDRERFQMDFLVHTNDANDYDSEIAELGGRVLRLTNHRNPVRYSQGLLALHREFGPYDVVHSHVNNYSGLVLPVFKALRVPIRIAHSHNDISALQKSAAPLRKVYYRVSRSLINGSLTHGVAASSVAGQSLFGDKWMASSKYRTLYCGIDLTPFRGSAGDGSTREQLRIPKDAFVVGHVGSFTPQKNHAFLLEIARELVVTRGDIHVVLIGEGPLRAKFEEEVRSDGLSSRVHFLGKRPDVPSLMMHVMDAFILPSLHEGLPLVGMEAQAAGLPCLFSSEITREATILPETVKFLDIGDSGVWVNRIMDLIQTKPSRALNGLRAVADSPFNVQFSVRKLEGIYAGN